MNTSHRDCVGPMVPPPLWYVAGLAVGWFISARVGVPFVPDMIRWPLGALCLLAGIAFFAPAVASFARAKTSVLPIMPTTALVESGPYRFTRNPMYVGLAIAIVGISLVTNWLWAIAVLPIVLTAVYFAAIRPEEQFLEERFGPDYSAYGSRVRRWL
jgi:protein-S-isoprenylcysteine O-methyltransferase Ste14